MRLFKYYFVEPMRKGSRGAIKQERHLIGQILNLLLDEFIEFILLTRPPTQQVTRSYPLGTYIAKVIVQRLIRRYDGGINDFI